VGSVVARADRQQEHILSGELAEGEGNRDGAAFARKVGLHTVHGLNGSGRRCVVGVIEVGNPGLGAMEHVSVQFVRTVSLLELLPQMIDN